MITNTKNRNRLLSISGNALRQLLVSAINMVIPILVIRYSSKETWGAFVSLLLFTLIAQQFINWGNKEFLIRKFSAEPGKIATDYSAVLFTRFPIVAVFAIVAVLYFPAEYGGFIFLWLLGRFFTQSAEALVVFEKSFGASLAIELCCFALFCGAYWFLDPDTSVVCVLAVYAGYQFIKGAMYFGLFRRFVSFAAFRSEKAYFKEALPFFLLSVLGFLVSKADVYLVDYFSSDSVTAEYQVINSLLVFVSSVSAFIYVPFTKNIYRNNEEVVRKTNRLVMLCGLAIIPPALVCIHYILLFYLEVTFPWQFYILCFLYIFPAFAYGMKIIGLFRLNREKKVIACLSFSAVCNIVLSGFFLYLGYGIMGALLGSVIAQFLNWYLFGRH